MQKIALTLLCVSMLILPGCQQDERVGVFDVVQVVEFTVPAGLNVVETHFFQLSNVNSSFDDQLEATGFESSDIASVEPRYCEVRTVFDDIDLDFVRAIEVHLFDPFLAQARGLLSRPGPGQHQECHPSIPGLAEHQGTVGQSHRRS